MTGMTCRKAEEMVNKYIAHKLSVDELEDFLDHVESCSSCYDELETYFIVHRALQQLDEKRMELSMISGNSFSRIYVNRAGISVRKEDFGLL